MRPVFEQYWFERFRGFGSRYDDDASIAGWSATGLETRLRQFARMWPGGKPGGVWLDAGCGAGTYSRFLAQNEMRVMALDYSLPSVVKAHSRGTVRAISWINGDATRLPVRPASFDGALSLGVTQALDSSLPLVRELAAATRPGGQVWVDALNAWSAAHLLAEALRRLRGKPRRLRYETPGRLRAAMRASGLEDVKLFWLPVLPRKWQRLQPLAETRFVRALFRALPFAGALLSHSFVLRGTRSQAGAARVA